MVEFISDHWAVLSASPLTWILYTLILVPSTFALSRIHFNEKLEAKDERLKLANDEMSRLKDQREALTKKLLEHGESIAKIQTYIAAAPKIYRGTTPPQADLGKDGDIYLQVIE